MEKFKWKLEEAVKWHKNLYGIFVRLINDARC